MSANLAVARVVTPLATVSAIAFAITCAIALPGPAEAAGFTQTAPRAPVKAPSVNKGAVPANVYFDRGTHNVRQQNRRAGTLRQPGDKRRLPHVERSPQTLNNSFERRRSAGTTTSTTATTTTTKPIGIAQSVSRPRRLHQIDRRAVWSSRDSAGVHFGPKPVRSGNRIDRSGRLIDRQSPWAARDSAGVRFGSPGHMSGPRPIPRTSDLRAPQAPYVLRQPLNSIERLPRNYRVHRRNGVAWYAADKHWYQRNRSAGFVVVVPPIGFTAPFLPAGMVRERIDGRVYYRGPGVAYRQAGDVFVVVDSESSMDTLSASGALQEDEPLYYAQAADIYVDPINGQTRNEFKSDLARCLKVSEAETGIDSNNRVSVDERFSAASRICLERAGYKVL